MTDPRNGEGQHPPLVETLTITNNGTTGCHLGGEGGPGNAAVPPSLGVQALAPDRTTPVLSAEGGYTGDSTLAPGKSVSTTIETASAYGLDDDRCVPKQVGAYRIYPPTRGTEEAVVTVKPHPVCTNRDAVKHPLTVGGISGGPG